MKRENKNRVNVTVPASGAASSARESIGLASDLELLALEAGLVSDRDVEDGLYALGYDPNELALSSPLAIALIAEEPLADLRARLWELPKPARAAFRLRYHEEASDHEIARKISRSLDFVRQLLGDNGPLEATIRSWESSLSRTQRAAIIAHLAHPPAMEDADADTAATYQRVLRSA